MKVLKVPVKLFPEFLCQTIKQSKNINHGNEHKQK